MENDERRLDLYGENDIPKSKILNIEHYMDKHAEDIYRETTLLKVDSIDIKRY